MTESADASRTSKAIDFDAVARFYDAHVTTTVDLNFWVEQCQAHRGPRLELMCGSGRISLAVLAAGIDLCCVDYSRGLLARLSTRLERERGPGWGRAEIIEDDARSLAKLGARRFGLVFIGFHAIAELCELDDLRACLAAITSHLAADGVVMISLHDPAVRGPECDGRWVDLGEHPVPDADSRVAVRGRWLLGAENRAVRGEQVYVERGPDGQTLTQVELPVRFRLWTPAQIEAAAGEHGLVQRACFGDYQGGDVGPSSRVRIIEFARKQS